MSNRGISRKFKVGDLVDAKDRYGVRYQDGVVTSVSEDDRYTYHIVHAHGIGAQIDAGFLSAIRASPE